jgi:DegV family protein with EDD domain
MTRKIRIVVDSAADFSTSASIGRYKMTVVPQTIHFGSSETYAEGENMSTEAFFQRLSHNAPYPVIQAPSVEKFQEVYAELSQTTDKIISVHSSHHISDAWQNAKDAAESFKGRCEIAVIDSQSTSAGLGFLAEVAARAADTTQGLEDAVRVVRGTVDRIYSIFYVDTLAYIQKKGLIGEAQAILGTMLGIKPFLTMEEGRILTMEKVRTRSQAIEKLVEFILEFESIEKLVILQNSPFTTVWGNLGILFGTRRNRRSRLGTRILLIFFRQCGFSPLPSGSIGLKPAVYHLGLGNKPSVY